MQPPVGHPLETGFILSAWVRGLVAGDYGRQVLEPELAAALGVPFACAVSSGKAALTLMLEALHQLSGRRHVVIPAYTCYSLPSAVRKAGLEVLPCDIGPSFDYDCDALAKLLTRDDVLCVVSVHLFGIPADTRRIHELCRGRGVFVLEDAAQAFGIRRDGVLLGASGDAGFFSFGRGKHLSAGGGGLIVSRAPEVADALVRVTARLPAPAAGQNLQALVTLLAMRWLISPALYWLPAGLPFLRLGETIFHEDFPVRRLSAFQAHLLHDWAVQVERLNAIRMEHSAYYRAHLTTAPPVTEAVPYLRYPVVLPDAGARRRLFTDRDAARFGVSQMYPATVAEIPQLRSRLTQTRFPEAERIAASLVTLPTHPMVSERDRAQIVSLVNEAMSRSGRPVEAPFTPTLPQTP
jgi:dTDP-4-amino-4,6-dideoxygalactose transaminase